MPYVGTKVPEYVPPPQNLQIVGMPLRETGPGSNDQSDTERNANQKDEIAPLHSLSRMKRVYGNSTCSDTMFANSIKKRMMPTINLAKASNFAPLHSHSSGIGVKERYLEDE